MNYNKLFNYFKYLIREQLEIIKNKRCNYLLYTTGSGGEFLGEIIKEYSDKKFIPSYRVDYNEQFNRYRSSSFFLNFFGEPTLYEKYKNSNFDMMFLFQFSDEPLYKPDIKFWIELLSYELESIDLGYNMPLIRSHEYIPQVMSDVTYFINPDTDYYFEHSIKNMLCKVFLYEVDLIQLKKDLVRFNYSYDITVDLAELGIDKIPFGRVEYILQTFDHNKESIIRGIEMTEEYEKIASDWVGICMPTVEQNIRKFRAWVPESRWINMSELYDGGKSERIKKMFGITDPNFDIRCTEWYMLNLELHKQSELR